MEGGLEAGINPGQGLCLGYVSWWSQLRLVAGSTLRLPCKAVTQLPQRASPSLAPGDAVVTPELRGSFAGCNFITEVEQPQLWWAAQPHVPLTMQAEGARLSSSESGQVCLKGERIFVMRREQVEIEHGGRNRGAVKDLPQSKAGGRR